jgi:putative FmdB family regulatory protein
MPIYEYKCEQGHIFEVMQRMSDDPLVSCQTCEAPVQRVFHPVAVHFKGSGFYNTDYGTRKRGREDGGSDDGGAKKEKEKSTGADSKPAAESKTESKASAASSSSD